MIQWSVRPFPEIRPFAEKGEIYMSGRALRVFLLLFLLSVGQPGHLVAQDGFEPLFDGRVTIEHLLDLGADLVGWDDDVIVGALVRAYCALGTNWVVAAVNAGI